MDPEGPVTVAVRFAETAGSAGVIPVGAKMAGESKEMEAVDAEDSEELRACPLL
jgi:hypothetical protein